MSLTYDPFTWDYRRPCESDLMSAARGLKMGDMTDEDLVRVKAFHATIDAFASRVIVEAADREINRRWEDGCDYLERA